jgi:hypothetical protein
MAIRTRAQLLAGFPDNTTKLVTPQNHRDVVDSITLASEFGQYVALQTGIYYVDLLGAVGNGTTDDTIAIASVITSMPSTGAQLQFGAKTYKTSATLLVNKPMTVEGYGAGTLRNQVDGLGLRDVSISRINFTPTSGFNTPAITVQADGVEFSRLRVSYKGASAPLSGCNGIYVQTGGNRGIIDKCLIDGFYWNIDWANGSEWSVINNQLYGFTFGGLRINNCGQRDAGDQVIHGNWFYPSTAGNAACCIKVESGGGGKYTQNKCNSSYDGGGGKASYGIWIQLALNGQAKADGSGVWAERGSGVTTVDALISANSFENLALHGVFLDSSGGRNRYQAVTVVGNQFGYLAPGGYAVYADGVINCAISGNSSVQCRGIFVDNSTIVTIGANSWHAMNDTATVPLISINSNSNTSCTVDTAVQTIASPTTYNANQYLLLDNSQRLVFNSSGLQIPVLTDKPNTIIRRRKTLIAPPGGVSNRTTPAYLWTVYFPYDGAINIELAVSGYLGRQGDTTGFAGFSAKAKRHIVGSNDLFGASGFTNGSINLVDGLDFGTIGATLATASSGAAQGTFQVLKTATIWAFALNFTVSQIDSALGKVVISAQIPTALDAKGLDTIAGIADILITGQVGALWEGNA